MDDLSDMPWYHKLWFVPLAAIFMLFYLMLGDD